MEVRNVTPIVRRVIEVTGLVEMLGLSHDGAALVRLEPEVGGRQP